MRYVERFAHFFSEPLFVRRCFETLNAEQRPELLGAAKAMQELFEDYRDLKGVSEELLVDFCYQAPGNFHEMFKDFDGFYWFRLHFVTQMRGVSVRFNRMTCTRSST